MDGPDSRSRRRSGTSSPSPPPEDLVFFIDRSLGRQYVAEALSRQGARVEVHDDHFSLNARDEEWLVEVGRRGWIVLMKDKRVRRIALEREALMAAGVRAFVLTAGNLKGPEMARIFTTNLPRIVRMARAHRAPFVAGVSASGIRMYRVR